MGVMSLRNGENRIVKSQLAALGIPLLQLCNLLLLLLLLNLLLLLDLRLLLLLLLGWLRHRRHLQLVLADAAAVRAVGSRRIGEASRAPDSRTVAAVVGR